MTLANTLHTSGAVLTTDAQIELLENHDCHLSGEDGCEACQELWELKQYRRNDISF